MQIFLSLILFVLTTLASEQPILLGNPYINIYEKGEMIYARNIWDMQLYQGKIYLGAGNSSNEGPASNAGRVKIFSLDPTNGKFGFEYEVAEEQVDIFKVYNKTLYVPGHDATENWDYGNIYIKRNGAWIKKRTLKNALHVYDLVVKNNTIFTAIGLNKYGAVFAGETDGENWEEFSQGKGRVYSFLELGNELLATKVFKPTNTKIFSVSQWMNELKTFTPIPELNAVNMFPDTILEDKNVKIMKTLKFNTSSSLYLGVYTHNDHQNIPFGAYYVSNQNNTFNASKIPLPEGSIPRDILVRNNTVYVLVNIPHNAKEIIKVLKFNKANWNTSQEVVSFEYGSFSRSFEEAGGCFYFGIGSEIVNPKYWDQSELKNETGEIIKICPQENKEK